MLGSPPNSRDETGKLWRGEHNHTNTTTQKPKGGNLAQSGTFLQGKKTCLTSLTDSWDSGCDRRRDFIPSPESLWWLTGTRAETRDKPSGGEQLTPSSAPEMWATGRPQLRVRDARGLNPWLPSRTRQKFTITPTGARRQADNLEGPAGSRKGLWVLREKGTHVHNSVSFTAETRMKSL